MAASYPIGPCETERLQALHHLQIWDSGPDPVMDRICQLASCIFRTPIVLISLLGESEQWFKAKIGTVSDRTPRELAFCNHTILGDEVLVVPDATQDLRFKDNPFVTGAPHARFYAGAPLSLDGQRLGSLCVIANEPRSFPKQDQAVLRELAAMASAQLKLHLTGVALKDSEEHLRLACQATEAGIWEFNRATGESRWSPKMLEILGLPCDSLPSPEVFLARVHPADLETARGLVATGFHAFGPTTAEIRIIRAGDGATRWVVNTGQVFPRPDGSQFRVVGAIRDITEQKLEAHALAESNKRLNATLQAGGLFVWQHDLETMQVIRSENSVEVIGLGSTSSGAFLAGVHPDDRARVKSMLGMEMGTSSSGFRPFDFRYHHPDGRTVWLSVRSLRLLDGRYLVGTTMDVTDRKAAEDEIWRAANHDPLTGLPNRALFQRRLADMLAELEGSLVGLNVLFVDIDDFKDVNDSLGEDAGDEVLRQTAERLTAFARSGGDMVARIGGDEFAVILGPPYTADNADTMAELILKDLSRAVSYADRSVEIRASIGLASYPEHDQTATALMRDADIALNHAKINGRSRVVAFSDALREGSQQRLALVEEVRSGIGARSFVAYYQPKICLRTNTVSGFEALARWEHQAKGLQTPGYFGTAFEDPELAYDIGEQIRAQVASDMRRWLDTGLEIGRVAVNLCSAEFARKDVADVLLETLHKAGVPTRNFEVEVTETVFLGKTSLNVSDALAALDQAGITIALDDFGTGFASLTHLKQFPVHSIKVDQSFVRGLGTNDGDEAIVSAVIGLGKNLKMHVTAEGIETDEQAEFLRRHHCDYAQGYLFGRPMPASRVAAFLRGWGAEVSASIRAA